MPFNAVIISMALLTAVYLVLGGYLAAAVNDFIQGMIMLIGIIAVTCLIIFNPEIGGFAGGMAELERQSGESGRLTACFAFRRSLRR